MILFKPTVLALAVRVETRGVKGRDIVRPTCFKDAPARKDRRAPSMSSLEGQPERGSVNAKLVRHRDSVLDLVCAEKFREK